jgi:hypothetical protein
MLARDLGSNDQQWNSTMIDDHTDDDSDDDVLPVLIELTKVVSKLNMYEPHPLLALLVDRAQRIIDRHEREPITPIRIQ